MLAFFGSFLLGETYLPTLSYFWGLGVGRILLGLTLLVVPVTNAGRFRPLLLVLVIGALGADLFAPDLPFLNGVLLVLIYLVLEVSLDSLVIRWATEQELPLELGWLAGCRMAGLWSGLFVQHSALASNFGYRPLTVVILGVLLFFWLLTREELSDRFLPTGWDGEGRKTLRCALREIGILRHPWTLGALLNLFCFALLTGYNSGAILPYPLLHPDGAGLWLGQAFRGFQILGSGLLMAFILERLVLRVQLIGSAFLVWGLLLSDYFLKEPLPLFASGVLVAGSLTSTRMVLRESYKVDPVLRAILIVTFWIVGGVLGENLRQPLPAEWALPLNLVTLVILSTVCLLGWKHYGKAAKEIRAPLPPPITEARHGDRSQDFEAVPDETRKVTRSNKTRRMTNQFLLRIPSYVIAVALIVGVVRLGLFVSRNEASWEKQMQDTTRVFKTELFLSAFSRRLTEEMLASRRVPDDWNDFISTSFHSNGVPLSDIDEWGTPYRFLSQPRWMVVTSAGPDRIFGSPDDLEVEISKPEGVR